MPLLRRVPAARQRALAPRARRDQLGLPERLRPARALHAELPERRAVRETVAEPEAAIIRAVVSKSLPRQFSLRVQGAMSDEDGCYDNIIQVIPQSNELN